MKVQDQTPIDQWEQRLRVTLREDGLWRRLVILHETDSTQDAARRLEARIGDVVIAGRQTRGRGRLGRSWADTDEDGVAMTMVMPRDRPERLAIASAVAVCDAIAAFANDASVGIKWPNDIMVKGRKVAGILIEQVEDCAYVGVGVNVGQRAFDPSLADSAISLHQLGDYRDRVAVLGMVLHCVQWVMRATDADIVARFEKRDVLTGTICGFRTGEREVRGQVLRVDPMKGLAVLTETAGEVWLPAATTSVIKE